MRDWLRLANEAADEGNVIAVLCFLEAEKVNSRLDHKLETAELRRRIEEAQDWQELCQSHRKAHGGVGHDPICLSSATRLCESPPMSNVLQSVARRLFGG